MNQIRCKASIITIFLIVSISLLCSVGTDSLSPLQEFPDEEITGVSGLKTTAIKQSVDWLQRPAEPQLDSLPAFFTRLPKAPDAKPIQQYKLTTQLGFASNSDYRQLLLYRLPISNSTSLQITNSQMFHYDQWQKRGGIVQLITTDSLSRSLSFDYQYLKSDSPWIGKANFFQRCSLGSDWKSVFSKLRLPIDVSYTAYINQIAVVDTFSTFQKQLCYWDNQLQITVGERYLSRFLLGNSHRQAFGLFTTKQIWKNDSSVSLAVGFIDRSLIASMGAGYASQLSSDWRLILSQAPQILQNDTFYQATNYPWLWQNPTKPAIFAPINIHNSLQYTAGQIGELPLRISLEHQAHLTLDEQIPVKTALSYPIYKHESVFDTDLGVSAGINGKHFTIKQTVTYGNGWYKLNEFVSQAYYYRWKAVSKLTGNWNKLTVCADYLHQSQGYDELSAILSPANVLGISAQYQFSSQYMVRINGYNLLDDQVQTYQQQPVQQRSISLLITAFL
jgi:hypothetical protein